MFLDLDPFVISAAVISCALAGFVKGVSGMGVQAVCVPILALVAPLETAIALGIASTIATSLWQALFGGFFRVIVARIWTLALACVAAIFVGVAFLAQVNQNLLGITLGLVLIVYASYAIGRPTLPSIAKYERWLSPTVGAATGLIGGATGVFLLPAAPYYQMLRLSRDEIVQTASLNSLIILPTLAVALGSNSLLTSSLATASLLLLGPTFVGLWIGTSLRRSLSELDFRKWFIWVLFFLGASLVIRDWLF
jgi:uncharacterized membrane protein YfcA